MNTQKGFVGVGALIAIFVGLAVIGGGAYYVTQQEDSAPQTTSEEYNTAQQSPVVDTNNQPTQSTDANNLESEETQDLSQSDGQVITSTGSVPDISKLIQKSAVGVRSVLADQSFENFVNDSASDSAYQWLYNPSEVVKKFAPQFDIKDVSQVTEGKRAFGEGSGLCHTSVMFSSQGKQYESRLMAHDCNGPWIIQNVIDKTVADQNSKKLRVFGFTEDSSSPRFASDMTDRQASGETIFMLDTEHPVVSFNLNNPANPQTVNNDTIVVKVDGEVVSGATAEATTWQTTAPDGTEITSPIIKVDLSNVSNLSDHIGQIVQITLTDKIESMTGSPLEQCGGPYDNSVRNPGACVTDTSGQRIESFGAELELY